MLKCCICGIEKPEDDFHRNARAKRGRQSRCKDCDRIREKSRTRTPEQITAKNQKLAEWTQANKERIAARMREYTANPEVKAKRAARSQEHRARNPAKYRARYLVSNAIASRRLIPGPCASCGSAGETHAHHADYDKPLEVTWLCRPCHVEHHKT